ncbi:hypothetical protein EDB81DRAFT_906569 [Dactylonectria macrodidyma]|uniref:Rhodopsin domain-containing protein n=1 Tax=Dactylonectria macrodidyma TaxID=307937 RepID=A0A9P9INC2_9HYPO|nr:hypothetical protein EDB81DRAFT_906569 [Dactylonectria macrodidyma]
MAGLQTNVYVSVGITWFAALLALIARICARRITKVRWWWDDYLCVGAFATCCAYSIILLIWTKNWYLGQFLLDSMAEEVREDILKHARFAQFLASFSYSYSIGLSKLSILLFYWRIFKLSAIRIPIQVMLAVVGIWLILRTFMVVFHCVPVRAYWDKSITNATCNINDTQFFFGTCLTHSVMDIVILTLPIIEVFKLHLRLGQKIAITALFAIGFIVCLASTFVIIESIRYDVHTTQMPHDMALNNLWGSVELNIAIVCGCFPLLRPIFKRILPKSFLSSASTSYPISGISRATHGVRLATISRRNKETEANESSSTHQLADPEQGLSEFEVTTGQGKDGPQTYISSYVPDSRDHGMAGIHVRNDMVVEVEQLHRAYSMTRLNHASEK